MSKQIIRVWHFVSDSNSDIQYETLQFIDGSTSCNCKGWTRRVAPDGSRSCKHTRFVDMGLADQYCTATHDYETHQNHEPQRKEPQNAKVSKVSSLPKLGHRKFAV
jgi:hypothetical protein